MAKAKVTRDIEAGAHEVWEVVADFGNMGWMEGPEKIESIGEGIGQVRRIHLGGMDPIEEVLEALDHAARTLQYSIPKNAVIPFDNYLATVVVSGDEKSSQVEWSCELDEGDLSAADAEAMMVGAYNSLIDALEKQVVN